MRTLESKGIGRPSTYAAIIGTIQDRGYVYLEQKHFYPTDLGFAVTDQLVAHFPEVINVEFTAGMESQLDAIEEGKADWVATLDGFYAPFQESLTKAEGEMQDVRVKPQETDEECELCGKKMLRHVGKRGPFLACSGYPECKNTRPVEGNGEGGDRPQKAPAEPTDQVCDKCGSPMVIRTGKRGRFLARSAYPKCKNAKPLPEEEAAMAALAANEVCEQCGAPMAVKRGRFGQFLGCTRYPECKGIKKLPKKPVEETAEDADQTRAGGAPVSACGRNPTPRLPSAPEIARVTAGVMVSCWCRLPGRHGVSIEGGHHYAPLDQTVAGADRDHAAVALREPIRGRQAQSLADGGGVCRAE